MHRKIIVKTDRNTQSSSKKVCIVVPVFKSHIFLSRFFNSLNVKQDCDGFSWSLYFVEDSPESNFDWKSFIRKLRQDNLVFDEIRCIFNNKNRGVTFSRNRAYMSSGADYCVFFDSDDKALPFALELIGREISLMTTKFNVLLLATSAAKDIQKPIVTEDYMALLDDYGKGERLVITRVFPNKKPFFGALRGHELAGLLRFSDKTGGGVKCSNVLVRSYLNDNQYSISKGTALKTRLPYLIRGHLWTGRFLFTRQHFRWSARFLLAALKLIVIRIRGAV